MEYTKENLRKYYREHTSGPIGSHRFFSVLVPIMEVDGKLSFFFERRASHMESQPGEICFPGGNMEPRETPLQCAVRETYEETGITEDKIEILGEGNTLYGYANYTLYTTVAFLKNVDIPRLNLSKDEVYEVFTVPLDRFTKENLYVSRQNIYTDLKAFPYEKYGITEDYSWRIGNWDIPLYDVDGRKIWGLTARIISDIVDNFGVEIG